MSKRPILAGAVSRALGGAPKAAWICALIACLNAVCWSLITPPFQVPDETSHFAYVQELAQTGSLPSSQEESFSPAEEVALRDLNQPQIRYNPQAHTIFTQGQQSQLEHDLSEPYSRTSPDGGVATSEPPLYYALQTIPYYLGAGGSLLDSDALMRLFSSLLAGITALFAFLFVRETLPGTPWAWTVGGLSVALAPLLALMSGAVNPDAQLYAVSAALFYCLARGFRRGLTPKLAIAIGVSIAVGFLTKLNFIGLIPGTALGLIFLTARAARISRRAALRSLASALAAAGVPISLYVIANLLSGRPASGTFSNGLSRTAAHGSLLREASYIWQFYLPRLPGMHDYFPYLSTTIQVWFDNFVGLYGWFDTTFPPWVERLALIPAALLAGLFLRALVGGRGALGRRLAELVVYLAMTLGLMVLVGANDYLAFPSRATEYAQPRYLLPMLALFGAGTALAARGVGRRWGPVAGAAIVMLFLAHDLFSGLLEISRYYYG